MKTRTPAVGFRTYGWRRVATRITADQPAIGLIGEFRWGVHGHPGVQEGYRQVPVSAPLELLLVRDHVPIDLIALHWHFEMGHVTGWQPVP